MKLTTLLLFTTTMLVSASVYSQSTRLTLSFTGISYVDLFQRIEKQTEFRFAFSSSKFDPNRKISVNVAESTLEQILDEVLPDDITYDIVDRYVVIHNAEMAKSKPTGQQPNSITGRVSDETGNPLPGVTVAVKGKTQGTVTDVNGNYSISNVQPDAVLLFSFVGMKTQEIPIAGKTSINVTMAEDAIGIEEVVAIGYGYVAKSDLTGSVSSVSTRKTLDIPNTNVLQTLQGSVAGLNVTTPDRPGESPAFIIRGRNSLSASNTPLVVVDGIIYNGSLNDFNVNDIEKIDILKDASAASVYGSRSANGVIIITTKMGKTSKPTFNFNTYYGLSAPVYLIPVLNGPKYIQKILDFREAVGLETNPNKIEDYLHVSEVENYKNGKTINWYDRILEPGISQDYNLNVSGRTEKTNYYLSGTYFNQKGIIINDNFERLTIKANFTNKITDWYSISLKTAFSSMDYSGVPADLYYYGLSPYATYWEDEAQGIYKEFPMDDPQFTHPLISTLIDNKDIRTSLLGIVSSELDVPFIKGLKWTLNYSTNLRNQKVDNFWDNTMQVGDGKTSNGRAKKEIYENYDWTFDNIINYKRKFQDVHSVDVTLLYSREYLRYEATTAEANDFLNQTLGYNNLGLGTVQQTGSDLQDQNSVAYMARINYIYNNNYSLTATVRKDGFSGFGKDKKYAVFPSIALAWTLSNEDFLKSISWLDLWKLRVSYGENGNQALGRYQTLARIADSQYIFGDGGSTITTVYVNSMANNNLGWETTKVKNAGIDFGLFNNRLNGNVDLYSSNTYDILLKRNIPATSGFSEVWTNIGKVHNQGVELTVNSVNIEKNDFRWESGFTFALNRNRIDELLGEDLDGDGKEDDNIANSWFIGKPMGVIYGYKTNGIHQMGDTDIPTGFIPGDFRLVDMTGDSEISSEDRTVLGSTLPNYTFSISNTVRYKNISLYVLVNSIQGGGKDNYYVGNNIDMHNVNNRFQSWTERCSFQDVPYWTPTNPSNEYARINYIPSRSHPYLEDRSFVRLQDINIAYTFNEFALKKLGLLGLRIYVSGKNLYTWTKWTGYDPENSTTVSDFPMIRYFTLGVDIKF